MTGVIEIEGDVACARLAEPPRAPRWQATADPRETTVTLCANLDALERELQIEWRQLAERLRR